CSLPRSRQSAVNPSAAACNDPAPPAPPPPPPVLPPQRSRPCCLHLSVASAPPSSRRPTLPRPQPREIVPWGPAQQALRFAAGAVLSLRQPGGDQEPFHRSLQGARRGAQSVQKHFSRVFPGHRERMYPAPIRVLRA